MPKTKTVADLQQWLRWAKERRGAERTEALESALTFARALVAELEAETAKKQAAPC